jgi:hypothetical protein
MKHVLTKGEVCQLIPDSGQGGLSRETYLIRHEGKKYVLRVPKNKNREERYFEILNKLSKYGYFPKLLCKRGKRFLFEHIGGRDCKKSDALKVAYEVGKIAGIINKLSLKTAKKYDIDKTFFQGLRYLLRRKIIDKEKFSRIKKLYMEMRKKAKPMVAIDLVDIVPSNFRIQKGKVYLVDIDAIKSSLKGRGIAKGFLKWFKTPRQRERFRAGHSSVAPIRFLTENYLKFSYLFFLVTNTYVKAKEKRSHQKNLVKLNLMLKGKLK